MQLNFHLSRLFGFTMWHWNHWMNSLGCQPCWRRYWMSTGSLNLFPGWNPFDTTRGLLSSLPPGVGIATVVKKLGCFFPRHENEGANYWRQSTVNVWWNFSPYQEHNATTLSFAKVSFPWSWNMSRSSSHNKFLKLF